MDWLLTVYWWIWLVTGVISIRVKCLDWRGGAHRSLSIYSSSFCIYDSVSPSWAFLIERITYPMFLFVCFSSVPNRYTFTCPYCNCPNLDQDGLIEHCTSLHARDARQVVGDPLGVSTVGGAYILNLLWFLPGVSHLCLDALGRPRIQECRLLPAFEDQAHVLLRHLCCK